MRIKAIVYKAPGEVGLEAVELGPCGEHEVLCETIYSFVSPGTELRNLSEFNKTFPCIPGYAYVGRIIEVGHSVKGWRVGDLISGLADSGYAAAAETARRESRNIELAGELIASEGRYIAACQAFDTGDASRLRTLIEAEIEGRIRQQEISGHLRWGAGVNPILVDEDIQNMRLYLSRDDFPNTPDACFHFTATPYSV